MLPLRGMAIGDGWIDPVNMIPAYPAMIYNLGLCDEAERARIQDYCDRTVSYIQQGKMKEAFDVWDKFLNGDVWPYGRAAARLVLINSRPLYSVNDCRLVVA